MHKRHVMVEPEIVLAAKQGNIHAFEHIVLQYERPVFTFIFRMIAQQEDAEELTQETFLKIYRHIDGFDTRKELGSWIFTIARRVVYDRLRKKQKERQRENSGDPGELATQQENATPEKQLEHAAQVIDLRAALLTLQPRHKEALLLYYWQGFTYAEVAEILAVPINTVKSLLYRAKKAILAQMNK